MRAVTPVGVCAATRHLPNDGWRRLTAELLPLRLCSRKQWFSHLLTATIFLCVSLLYLLWMSSGFLKESLLAEVLCVTRYWFWMQRITELCSAPRAVFEIVAVAANRLTPQVTSRSCAPTNEGECVSHGHQHTLLLHPDCEHLVLHCSVTVTIFCVPFV